MSTRSTAERNTDTSHVDMHPHTAGGKYSTWFGPESESLFGTVHVPAGGRARGGVILCPPLGKEQVDSYRGLTLLAQKLCDSGLLVLRFDYYGTGDSAGDQDSKDIVSRWTRSIVTAAEFVRSSGVDAVALVGLRAGALLSTAAFSQLGPLTAVALWDPVVRGRSYLREQRALYSVSVTQDSDKDARVSIIGAVLHPDVGSDLAALDISKLPPIECPVLVATRPERADAKPLRALVEKQNAEEHTLSDHELFLEPSDFEVVMPTADITHLARWISERFDGSEAPVSVPLRDHAEFGSGESTVIETAQSLGPNALFAIRTTSPSCARGGPTLVLYPTANEHRVGPVRLWIEVARHLAAHGVSVLRFDRRGTGESGPVSDGEITELYSEEGNEDALTAVQQAGAGPRNVMVSGMCSGSWYSSFAAAELGVNSAVLLNSLDWTTKRLEFVKRSSMVLEDKGFVASALDRLHHVGVRVKNGLQPSMPYRMWLWLGLRGLIQVPEISLRRLASKNVRTTVLLSPTDTAWFVDNRGPEGMRRLRKQSDIRSGSTTVKSFEAGDHSLYSRDLRETVRRELVDAVNEAFDMEIGLPAPPVPVRWQPL